MRKIVGIGIHCSATRPEWWENKPLKSIVNEFRKWHLARGWSDIGYHYVIGRNGQVELGRPLERDGAHIKGWNTGTIGICLVGGHGAASTDRFEDHFTPEQDAALRQLIGELQDRFGHGIAIKGHNELSAKGCPGFQVGPWLAKKAPRTSLLSSTTIQASAAGVAAAASGGATAIGSLDGNAQIVAIVAVAVVGLAFLWIARERIKKWGRGVR